MFSFSLMFVFSRPPSSPAGFGELMCACCSLAEHPSQSGGPGAMGKKKASYRRPGCSSMPTPMYLPCLLPQAHHHLTPSPKTCCQKQGHAPTILEITDTVKQTLPYNKQPSQLEAVLHADLPQAKGSRVVGGWGRTGLHSAPGSKSSHS